MTQIRIIDNCFNPTQIGSQQDQHAARILFLMFFHHTYTRRVVAKQYLRESAIIPAAPSRYLRRDTLVDLCCNSSWPLSQESIGRSRGICFRRSRTYHDDCFSKSLYSLQARFIVTLLLLLLLAVHTFYYYSHSVDDPAVGFANGFLCDITKRGISARYSLSLSLSLFLSTQLHLSHWIEVSWKLQLLLSLFFLPPKCQSFRSENKFLVSVSLFLARFLTPREFRVLATFVSRTFH